MEAGIKDNSLQATRMYRTVLLKTPHFEADLHLHEVLDESEEVEVVYFHVGEKESQQLSGAILLKEEKGDSIFLNNIHILHQSALEDIKTGYATRERFGTEVIQAFFSYVRTNYPSVRTAKFKDESHFQCRNESDDTHDVLIYSIALYGFTWYEKRLGAYTLPKESYHNYKVQLETYVSEDTKAALEWPYVYYHMGISSSYVDRARRIHGKFFEESYNLSKTLPEFFHMISTVVPTHERCWFFRYWLNRVINLYVDIDRWWYVDINSGEGINI